MNVNIVNEIAIKIWLTVMSHSYEHTQTELAVKVDVNMFNQLNLCSNPVLWVSLLVQTIIHIPF